MTAVMSYQYPPPPPIPGEADLLSSSTDNLYLSGRGEQKHPQAQFSAGRATPNSSRAQSTFLDLKKPPIRRAMSSPNVRKAAQPDASALAADKRRNKLGYQRTSVACGHCRRRKIRCMVAPNELQGRCSNCIKLKKDCNFFPVDQQPSTVDMNRRDVKPQMFRDDSNSPPPSAGPSAMMHAGIPYHLSVPDAEGFVGPSRKLRIDSFSPENKGNPYQGSNDPYNPQAGDWLPSDTASMPSKTPTDLSSPYQWRGPTDASMTQNFQSYGMTSQNPSQSSWTSASAEPRDAANWPLPQRSMSFGSLEGAHPNHPQNLPPNTSFMAYQPSPLPSNSRVHMSPRPRGNVHLNLLAQVPMVPSSATPHSDSMGGTPVSTPSAIEPGHPPMFPIQSQQWQSYTFDRAAVPTSGGYAAAAYAPATFYGQGSPVHGAPGIQAGIPQVMYGQPEPQQQQQQQQQQQFPGMYYPPPPSGS